MERYERVTVLTFSFITFLNSFASIIFTSVFSGNSAADANEGVRAKVKARKLFTFIVVYVSGTQSRETVRWMGRCVKSDEERNRGDLL